MLWRDGRNLRASQLLVVRRLKLSPPLLEFKVAHVERLIGRGGEPIGDTPALLLAVNRQVDDLATCANGASDPAQRRSFVLSPEPEVEDDIGAQLRDPHAELNQLAFDEVTHVRWVLIPE